MTTRAPGSYLYRSTSARVSNARGHPQARCYPLALTGGGMRPVPFILAASLVALPSPALDPPGGAGYGDMAVRLLREYLQIDTTNPPGHELRAARFYKRVLDREGIPAEIDEFAPGRANLLATLAGGGARRPLTLPTPMAVVPAAARRWPKPPSPA